MKRSLFTLTFGLAFCSGYVAHWLIENARVHPTRSAIETLYRDIFPVGESADHLIAAQQKKGVPFVFEPESDRFVAILFPGPSRKIRVTVAVDEQKRIEAVRVTTLVPPLF